MLTPFDFGFRLPIRSKSSGSKRSFPERAVTVYRTLVLGRTQLTRDLLRE